MTEKQKNALTILVTTVAFVSVLLVLNERFRVICWNGGIAALDCKSSEEFRRDYNEHAKDCAAKFRSGCGDGESEKR